MTRNQKNQRSKLAGGNALLLSSLLLLVPGLALAADVTVDLGATLDSFVVKDSSAKQILIVDGSSGTLILPEATTAPATGASEGAIYTKDDAGEGETELFYRDESAGTQIQLTNDGQVNALQVQTFTSNGSFVVPSGVTTVFVTVIGAGGGGEGGGNSILDGGGGGGGASAINVPVAVSPLATVAVTVGAGGAGGAGSAGGEPGGDGSLSQFGSITAPGGFGGTNGLGGAGGGNATATTGGSYLAGGAGAVGPTSGGGGGGTASGVGGNAGSPGLAGSGYGAGGGGGASSNGGGAGADGGAGAPGIVIVMYVRG